jgi:sulfur-oxidizing protein SoxY
MERREFINTSSASAVAALAVAAGLMPASAQAQAAAAWNKAAFEGKGLNDVAKDLGSAGAPAESKDLILTAPEIAENGNVVRLGAESKIAGTTLLALLVEKNPNSLAATFDVLPGADASFATNIKMGQSSNVFALAKAGDKYFFAVKEVKVTLGGCGG